MNTMQQQSQYEWMKYIPAVNEKFLGIAVIRYERRFIFRFKIMLSEHGGYWATTASLKTGNVSGKDRYEPAFSLDSDYEKTQMLDFVIACVEQELKKQVAPSASVFNSQASQSSTQYQQPQQGQNKGHNGTAYNSSIHFNDDNIPF